MNWGNKLLLAFLAFGVGMFYLVYRSVNTNYELVEKDYYKKELRYQQVIDGTTRANRLGLEVTIEQTDLEISIRLPDEMKEKKITGDIWFYCTYDEKKDRKFNLQTGPEGKQFIPKGELAPGNYTGKISWNDQEHDYFTEKYVTIP